MAYVSTKTSAGGVVNIATGRVSTDATAATVTGFVCGFVPRMVTFHNLTDRITDEWVSGMAAASSMHSVANGTRTLETTNGITVGEVTDGPVTVPAGTNIGAGFSVTATTMVASKEYAWTAIG